MRFVGLALILAASSFSPFLGFGASGLVVTNLMTPNPCRRRRKIKRRLPITEIDHDIRCDQRQVRRSAKV
jgi:hypothetical protein